MPIHELMKMIKFDKDTIAEDIVNYYMENIIIKYDAESYFCLSDRRKDVLKLSILRKAVRILDKKTGNYS